ncbi:LLM class F420-dependent oxidoreductase [Actinokineospora inagensis]|uniref:LLM class F420-dependent oxidoreductase n=1 Tax=Actinokineospora inagensis TaxID=103730 RepID=UPI0004166C59|nr:LLM class F420-dependent oxidoreductase [Actinokineospora inagensis]
MLSSDVNARPIRIGAHLEPEHVDYRDIRHAVSAVEDLGVDMVTTWDHFFSLSDDPQGRNFECWTMLAAWAEQTSVVEIGPLVSCVAYRNPDLIADMSRTLDHVSAGRFVLGLGSGWAERDFTEYGYEFGTMGSRADVLDEALPRIEARFAQLSPAPTRRIPVMIGGTGERRTLRTVARHADIWHGMGSPEELKHKHAVLDAWCGREGRDPASIERAVITDDPPGAVGGYGDQVVATGTTLIAVGLNGRTIKELDKIQAWVRWRDQRNADRPRG